MKVVKIQRLDEFWSGSIYAVTENGSTRMPTKAGTPTAVVDTGANRVTTEVHASVARVERRWTRLWLGQKPWAEAITSIHFEWAGEGPCPDVCSYCGFNNGLNGESRNGWDCGYCGSN